MALRDWFDKDKRRERTIARAMKKLRNPHVQPQERQRTIEILEGIGTPEAVRALLVRFTYRAPQTIVDEDEKRLVYEALLRLGDVCVEPLLEYLREQTALYWPLRALAEIAGPERAVDAMIEALEGTRAGFGRDQERREQLAANLREYVSDPRVVDKLVELTSDDNVEVRIAALDGLATVADDPRVGEALVARLLDDEETQRVRITVLNLLAEHRIDVSPWREALKERLPEMFFIDGSGFVQRRTA